MEKKKKKRTNYSGIISNVTVFPVEQERGQKRKRELNEEDEDEDDDDDDD